MGEFHVSRQGLWGLQLAKYLRVRAHHRRQWRDAPRVWTRTLTWTVVVLDRWLGERGGVSVCHGLDYLDLCTEAYRQVVMLEGLVASLALVTDGTALRELEAMHRL